MQKNHFLFPRPFLSILWAFLIILVFSFDVHSQSIIRLEPSPQRKAVFNKYFSSYALGTLDKGQVFTLLQSRAQFDTLTVEANDITYTFSLEANDVRAADYVLSVFNGSTTEQMPRSPNKTYTGKTLEGDLPVCITADEQFFTAMIMTSEGALFIESAKLTDPSAVDAQFVIYHERNVIQDPEHSMCGVVNSSSEATPHQDTSGSREMIECKEVELAIANDHLMFQKYGTVGHVELQNLAVINLVNTVYNNEFTYEIKHKVKEIVVVTGNDPWYTGTDPSELFDSFSAWAWPGGFSLPHDAGSLWTNRDFDGSTVGLGRLDALCGDDSYTIMQDYVFIMPLLRTLWAHELGHNYGYLHDAGPGYIMSPSVSETTDWSEPSITTLNTQFQQNGDCLFPCQNPPPPQGGVGIGIPIPNPTAILDITSTTKGLLIPRLTPLQREAITNPANGLAIYDTHTKSFWFYNGSQWVEIIDGTDFQKQGENIGIGLTSPATNTLDIATSPRENLHTDPVSHPTGIPVYITGDDPLYKGLEVRDNFGSAGVGLSAGNFRGEVYATGWADDVPLSLSTKSLGELQFRTNDTLRARITGNGSFAIGTTAPNASALLDVTSTTKGILIPRMTTAQRTAISNPVAGLLVFDSTTNSFWYRGSMVWLEMTDNLDQEIYRNGQDKIYMGLTDSVGIGTNDPKYKLDVNTAINQYGFAQTGGNVELASWIGDGGEIGTVSNHTMRLFAGNGFNQFALLPNGNIGIGTSTPNAPLQFSNATTNRKIVLYEASNDDHQFFGLGVNIEGTLRYQVPVTVNDHVFYAGTSATTSSELLRIKGTGNVTISGVVEVETFNTPALLNGFTQYENGFAHAAYYQDKMGRVFLRGTVNNVSDPDGLVIFNLPAGYRPSTSGRLMFEVINNGSTSRVDIMVNGDVVVITGTAGWVNLDGISFKAD